MAENVLEQAKDYPSSIEASENSKGQFSFKVKLYFNQESDDSIEVIDHMKDIYDTLHLKLK